eukprot:SAG31_NODE_11344_length_1040_cov_1.720510_2_plen_56_part_00
MAHLKLQDEIADYHELADAYMDGATVGFKGRADTINTSDCQNGLAVLIVILRCRS